MVPMILILADLVIRGLQFLLIASAIMSWFKPDPNNTIVKLINAIVDPLLHPIKTLLPAVGGMDFSPVVALLLLSLLQRLIIPSATLF